MPRDDDDLPDLVRAPDPESVQARNLDSAGELPPIDASAGSSSAPSSGWPLDPEMAAAARGTHDAPNALGKPARLNEAAQALADYQAALAAYREDYSGTRSERLLRPFLEAKERLIRLGLLKGDV